MINFDYWQQRERERERYLDSSIDRANKIIIQQLEEAKKEIQNLINSFWVKYADKNGITVNQAYQMADRMDVQAFAKQAQKYVEEHNMSATANRQMSLYNLKMKVSRYQLLLNQINLELAKLCDNNIDTMKDTLTDNAKQDLQTMQQTLGLSSSYLVKALPGIVYANHDNATFMDRWYNTGNNIYSALDKTLRAAIINGDNPTKFAGKLAKAFEVAPYEARRLLITESSFAHQKIQQKCYDKANVDEYVYVAESTACDTCKLLNRKHFKVSEMEPGENAQPMHPNCRCSTAPYDPSQEDDAFQKQLEEARKFKEANKHLGKPSAPNELSKDEEAAVKRYVGPDSYKLNAKLRSGEPLSNQEKAFVENLDYALDKLPKYSGEAPLYRSMYSNTMNEPEEFVGNLKPGNVMSSPAYTSTAKEMYDPEADIQISILESQSGADLAGKNGYNNHEQEVLFPRNAKFRIVNCVDKDGIYYISVKEV